MIFRLFLIRLCECTAGQNGERGNEKSEKPPSASLPLFFSKLKLHYIIGIRLLKLVLHLLERKGWRQKGQVAKIVN